MAITTWFIQQLVKQTYNPCTYMEYLVDIDNFYLPDLVYQETYV